MTSSQRVRRSQSKESLASTSYEGASIGSSSLISSKNERLKFLRKSPFKRVRRSFINLYSYLFCALPIQTTVCKIMFSLRLFQMFICSCFYPNEKLYVKGTHSYNVGVFLSIFTRLFPIRSDIEKQVILGWIYIAFFIIHICFLGFFSYYFAKKSTLPSFVPSLLSYVFLIIEHLPHCWAMSLIGNLSSQPPDEIKGHHIASIVLISITWLIFSILHQLLNLSSIFFTPAAFQTAFPWPQSFMTYTLGLICFLSEFSGHYSDKTVSIILMCIAALLYGLIFYVMVFCGQFLNRTEESLFISVTIGSIINTIISIIYFSLDKQMPEYIILIVAFIIFILSILCMFLRNYRFIKSIRILDQLEEDKANYSIFKRPSQILKHIFIGFQVNHRYCLSYAIFVDSLNVFENDISLLVNFAKFLAIYPEEYAQLSWTFTMIQKHPKKSLSLKNVKAQLLTILMRRESTLSNELKKKLQSISNLIVTAKMRIRNTWEAALSGSTSELEPLFLSYSSIIKQIDLKFTYLQNYHSNNQYALGALSNYERNVQANIELANIHHEKARRIKMGHNDSIDQVYLYGRVTFPNLPPRQIYQNFRSNEGRSGTAMNMAKIRIDASNNSTSSNQDDMVSGTMSGDGFEDEEHLYIQDMQTRLRHTILNLAIPSYRVNIAITLLMILIIFLIPFILVLVMIKPIENMISNPINYLNDLDKIHKMVLHLYGLTTLYLLQSKVYNMPDLCNDLWEQDGGVPENIGGDCNTVKMLIYFSNEATNTISEISDMKKDKSKNKILREVKDILFNNISMFYTFFSFYGMGPAVNKSLQQNVMDSVSLSIKIVSDDAEKYIESRELMELLFNSFMFETQIKALTNRLLEYIIDHTTDIKKIFTVLEITLSIIFPLIFVIVSLLLLKWNRTQKRKIYRCFNALPKTTVSKMIENSTFSTPKDKNREEADRSEKELDQERQEEKTITILRSGDIGSQITRIFQVLIVLILIVISNLVFVTYGCQYYIKNSNIFIHASPLLKYISYTYCDAFSSMLFLTIQSWRDNGLNHPAITDQLIIGYLITKLIDTLNSYQIMFYGDFEQEIYPASRYVDNFDKYISSYCSNQSIDADVEHTMYRCLSSDSLYYYYVNYIKKLFYTHFYVGKRFQIDSPELIDGWHIIFGHLYSKYLSPLTDEITYSAQHVFTSSRSTLITVSTILLIVGILLGFYYVFHLLEEEKELKQILLLLLHAPPQEILESSYIMAIISGDFSTREETGNNLDDNVFKSITENYPEGLILFNNANGNILYSNSKSKEFLMTKQVEQEDGQLHIEKIKESKAAQQQQVLPKEIILNQSSFKLNGRNLSAIYSKIETTKTLVSLFDMTKIEKLELEYDQETRRKSELMSKFMPRILISKAVSSQDQSVSFSVQSVTISMISLGLERQDEHSILAFNEAHEALSNMIVSKQLHTIESVEIVGDTFMVIGGLFDEVNQAERHAQEVVKFSLDALELIQGIKEKYFLTNEQTLCGVATGGPVSGGIIELETPIFEVCGDVVDLSEAMMSLGLPRVVHTTRAVYELIYGRDFQIKERGELQIPNFGNAVTYIVSQNGS